VQLSEYLADIPRFHTWDNGVTWNTGGFEATHLQPLFDFLRTHGCRRIVETGAGNSTITFLLTEPDRVVSIAPEAGLFDRIIAYCDEHGLSRSAWEHHVARSQWVLPKIAAEGEAQFDFALIDGAHGWPHVFVDFLYAHALLRAGGHVMLDDVDLHSVRELVRWLGEMPEYSLARDLGKALIFRKDACGPDFPEWNGQPYIVRLSRLNGTGQPEVIASAGAGRVQPARPPGIVSPGPKAMTASDRAAMAVPGGSPARRNRRFAVEQIDGAARSARIVVPLVMSLVRDVRSVIDVGCGAGVWLSEFKENGVPRVLGLSHDSADRDRLEIEADEFHTVDLEGALVSSEAFDLCICLETAQHLPESAASTLVQSLCALSDVVLFSAAVPGQDGTPQSNERWPSYWADLFQAAGYEVLDIVRGRTWNDARVEWWYRQNLLLFANRAGLARIARRLSLNGSGAGHMAHPASTPLDVVHPACFERYRLPIPAGPLHNTTAAEIPKQKKSGWRYLMGSYWQKRSGKLARSVTKRLPWRAGRKSR